LAAAYTSGALAAEFGPEHVRVALNSDSRTYDWGDPLLVEMSLSDALRTQDQTRLVGVVSDGAEPTWVLLTPKAVLANSSPLLVRALGAVLQARPHRYPMLDDDLCAAYPTWVTELPLKAANILVTDTFVRTFPVAA
jgi:hypothetical protein